MNKIWAKIIKDGKIVNSYVLNIKKFNPSNFHIYLVDISYKLDIPTPIILNKHIYNYSNFNSATFTLDDFIETINFDKLILENVSEE
jgi:hypothetical protein